MENIIRITEGLRNGEYTANPHQAANDLSVLAGEYAYIGEQLINILQRKSVIWNELRKSLKSDTSCERGWQATKDGMEESTLRLRAKSAEKMMSALKSIIRVADNEAHNLH